MKIKKSIWTGLCLTAISLPLWSQNPNQAIGIPGYLDAHTLGALALFSTILCRKLRISGWNITTEIVFKNEGVPFDLKATPFISLQSFGRLFGCRR